jgi:uncharacterized protein
MLDKMQDLVEQNDWTLFCRHYFQKCAAVNPELATMIASADLEYPTKRWFNSYARALKRARKVNAAGLVLHCSEDFQLIFKAVSDEETLWIEQSGYKFFQLDELRDTDESDEVIQLLRARVVGCLVDLVMQKKASDLTISIEFVGLDGVLHFPTHLLCSESLANPFEFEGMDDMKGNAQMLEEVAASGDIIHLKELLDQGADINTQCYSGENLLAIALGHLNFEMAIFLIESGIDIDPAEASNTPLEVAIVAGADDIIHDLLKRGVDVNRKGTDSDQYPLHRLAWGYTDPAIFQKFVDAGADATLQNEEGQIPKQISEDALFDNPEDAEAINGIIEILTP